MLIDLEIASSTANAVVQRPSKGLAGETHAFFKARITTTNTRDSGVSDKPSRQCLMSCPMPKRDTMHVMPLLKDGEAFNNKLYPTQTSRKRKRSVSRENNCSELAESNAWWQGECKRCLGRREAIHKPSETPVELAVEEVKNDTKALRHSAIRSMIERPVDHPTQTPVLESGSLWTTRYAPRSAEEVLQSGSEALILRDWLKSRKLNTKDRLRFVSKKGGLSLTKYANEYDDFIVDDEIAQPLTSDIGAEMDTDTTSIICPAGREQLWASNLVILCGPTGCGKSATIQAVANELSYEIFEVNASDRRSGKDVIERVGEAAQSQMVNKQRSADGSQSKSLLLFEEVDILYKDDKEFWNAVLSLAASSKRPVVLTCNDLTVLPTQLELPSIFLDLKVAPDDLAREYLCRMVQQEKVQITRGVILHEYISKGRDLRATINSLQFLTLKPVCRQILNQDLLMQEVLATGEHITSFYAATEPAVSPSKVSKSRFAEFVRIADTMSYIDVLCTQQRSLALEHPVVYENEGEEVPARLAEKDDLVGPQTVAEPYGRHTRLHPGDTDLAVSIAFTLQGVISQSVREHMPIWSLLTSTCRGNDKHIQHQQDEDAMWTSMMEACDSLAVPENWMQDYAPHNSIDRPRISGILGAQIMPYLREMTRLEEEREDLERAALASHKGRTTRNTMSNEFGLAWRRPTRIPAEMRREILATELHWAYMA